MGIGRVIVIVLDSVGIGALPDAADYGDEGSNTLRNLAKAVGGLDLPHLGSLGLGNIEKIEGVAAQSNTRGAYGKMAEISRGKDTTTGHWEMAGVITSIPFPTFPNGFPANLLTEYEYRIGRPTLGNKVASGTEIIAELGQEHMLTGYPIVYTSADSVFQIAAHEEIVPLEDLYRYCVMARDLLVEPNAVSRVIARPFLGHPGSFKRTENRRDYALVPPRPTLLDILKEAGQSVAAVGKIEDIFAHRGMTAVNHTTNNHTGVDAILQFMETVPSGLIYANLVDFDMVYGHRNDARGYAYALHELDSRLPDILDHMLPQDMLIITADHGCDPTTVSTDHSREFVPLLVSGKAIQPGRDLGIRESFADIGATVCEVFGLELGVGKSFLREVLRS